MFYNCTSLLDISTLGGWNVSNIENFYQMFSSCESLKDISTLRGWNVSNGKEFSEMFAFSSVTKEKIPSNFKDLIYEIIKYIYLILSVFW